MTKSKLVEIFKRLDDEKFTLLPRGISFEMIVKDREHGQFMHTGIGDGGDMSQMVLYAIVSLYTTVDRAKAFTKPTTIESFCEDIKDKAIKAYKEDAFNLEKINDSDLGGTL